MALFVDFVGLNTLIQEPIDLQTNTVGDAINSTPSASVGGGVPNGEVRNTQILTIAEGSYLAALNAHRNGPYGFSTFRQLRASENPIIRRHKLDNTFSHYRTPGRQVVIQNTKERRILNEKRGPLEHYSEVPVVSKHRPLRALGAVTTMDEKTKLDRLEPVEVFTTLGNQTQYFSNRPINEYFDVDEILDNDYENFIDLYLEGGIDSDESPIDEFRMLTYSQVVYPKELYTYKNHTRNRINFISRYWRDDRTNRTNTLVDNGFGFNIISQSAWVLDGEQDFRDLTFIINPGSLTITHPNNLFESTAWPELNNKPQGVLGSASAETFSFPDTGTGANQKSFTFTNLRDTRFTFSGPGKPIHGYGGYPNSIVPVNNGDSGNKTGIAVNPYDTSTGLLRSMGAISARGLRGAFETAGFDVNSTIVESFVGFANKQNNSSDGKGWTFTAPAGATWRTKTTASTLSTWLGPQKGGPASDYGSPVNYKQAFLSGTLYHEWVNVTASGGASYEKKLSKIVSFDPSGYGGVIVRYGTAFTSSATGEIVYFGANERGAVEYKTSAFYGVDNPIYKTANAFNSDCAGNTDSDQTKKASIIAATSINHLLVEMNLSGSHPALDSGKLSWNLNEANRKVRGSRFRAQHAHDDTGDNQYRDPAGYAKVYVNASASYIAGANDPYKFLSGSTTFQEQLLDGNNSIRLGNVLHLVRDNYYLDNTNWNTINPFTSKGFSFSYWFKFDQPLGDYGGDGLVFSIQDSNNRAVIDHTIDPSNDYLQVGFAGTSNGTAWRQVFNKDITAGWVTDTWYNVTFTILTGSTNMAADLQVYKKGQTTEEAGSSGFVSTGNYAGSISNVQFGNLSGSAKLYVLPAGASHPIILDDGGTPVNSDNHFDHINLDSLLFFNGGLTQHQMASLVSGSSNTDTSGLAGDKQTTISTANFPASDVTTALTAIADGGSLFNAHRTYEMNTYRDTIEGVSTGRMAERGDRYYPFGAAFYANEFQANVIDDTTNGGVEGEFDVSFWFKPSHENYRNRSLRWPQSTHESSDNIQQYFRTNVSRRNEIHKGMFISFWYRNNDAFSTTKFTTILAEEDSMFRVQISPNGGTDASRQRKVVMTIKGETSDLNTDGTNGRTDFQFYSNDAFPDDNQWHFVTIQWNGRTGPEGHCAFQVDGGTIYYDYVPWDETNQSPTNHEDLKIGWETTSDYARKIHVLNAPIRSASVMQSSGSFNGEENSNSNIAQLCIVQDPPNPQAFSGSAERFYNNGQYTDASIVSLPSSYRPTSCALVNASDSGANITLRATSSLALNAGHTALTEIKTDGNQHKPLFVATFDASVSDSQPDSHGVGNAGGYTLSFNIGAARFGTNWAQSSPITLFQISDTSGNIIIQATTVDDYDVNVKIKRDDGAEVSGRFANAAKSLWAIEDVVNVQFTWNGEATAAGVIQDMYLYVGGTQYAVSSATFSSMTGYASGTDIMDYKKIGSITIGGHPDGNGYSGTFRDYYYLHNVRFYSQYSGHNATLRKIMAGVSTITSYNSTAVDASWTLPKDYTSQNVTYHDATITGVNYVPPVIDCPISKRLGDTFEAGSTINLKNYANTNPSLIHYYRLGQEPEVRQHILNTTVSRNSAGIQNSGSAPTPLSASVYSVIDSGPKYWNVEWYGKDGDINLNGIEQARSVNSQDPQQLFYVADGVTDVIPRSTFNGIEIYLSASGGGYHLESVIGRSGVLGLADMKIRSTEDLIVPNRWHHLHASFSGLTDATSPSATFYLNGKEITTMHTYQTGSGNFDELVSTSASGRPTIGGASYSYVRGFSGFIQDIAFWNDNDATRPAKCRNVWEGIYNGSDYIDTSDSNLLIALKTGFLNGDTPATITRLGGLISGFDGSSKSGLTDVSRAFVTGPPIKLNHYASSDPVSPTDAVTVVSFWASLDTNSSQDIIFFNSDDKFPKNFYEEDKGAFANNVSNPADTSGVPTDNSLVRTSITLSRNTQGVHALRVRNHGVITSQYNSDVPIRIESNQGQTSVFSHSDGSLVHHTVMLFDDAIYWYENATFIGTISLSTTNIIEGDTNGYVEAFAKRDGVQYPAMVGGWNNITVLPEQNPFQTNSVIDEVAVFLYPETDLGVAGRTTLVNELYNNGAVRDLSDRTSNLYAWWRMGEFSNGSPISLGTTITSDTKIDDASSAGHHLFNVFSQRLQTSQRASAAGTDLKNYYTFDVPYTIDSSLPNPSNPTSATDAIGSKTLTVRNDSSGAKWTNDFTFDSFELWPLNWLACEGEMIETVFAGQTGVTGISRLTHDAISVGGGENPVNVARVGDTAIFSGCSTIFNRNDSSPAHSVSDKTTAKTIIKLNALPAVGDVLTIIMNPRNVNGGATETLFKVEFVNDGTVSTSFPGSKVASIDVVGSSPSIADVIDRLENLLDDSSGLGTTNYTFSQPATDTLAITADNAGGDGKYEVVAEYNGTATAPTISSVIGYSHISKGLTRAPNFGWRRQDDSDFSRVDNENSITAEGLIGSGAGVNKVKPYWYVLNTYQLGVGDEENYSTNIGLSAGNHNLVVLPDSSDFSDGSYGSQSGYFINSGSLLSMTLDNTPTLPFNNITVAEGTYLLSSSLTAFDSPDAPEPLIGGSTGARSKFGPGILQNSYNQFAQLIDDTNPSKTIDSQLSASACYFRRHSLTASTSFVAPYGGFLQKLSASHDPSSSRTVLLGNMSASHLFLGSAKWEAGDFAGYFDDNGVFQKKAKKPFYDTYQDFVSDARPIMKDHGIVPEFKISNHINEYLKKGPTEQKLDFLNITGGLEASDSSEKDNFYEIYSTTDFLKHFEIVQEDHSDFVDPFAIRLRCSVVKKFLPYEGFYPAQRTVQVAQQFYNSYGDNITVTASQGRFYNLDDSKYGVQYLLNPLFSPGILYNTIKSGVAVDYPLITDTGSVLNRVTFGSGSAMITEQFDTRVPFEALIEPEKHLANIALAGNEPDPSGDTGIQIEWGGQGDQLYNLMVSNFLAETSEFFLENKSFTSIASLSQGDANFGNAEKGNIYTMRLKMFRTTEGNKPAAKNQDNKSFGVPQDSGSISGAFTMYSRPSAFGPPQYLSQSSYGEFTAETWSGFKFDGTSGSLFVSNEQSPVFDLKALPFQHEFSYNTGSAYGVLLSGTVPGDLVGGHLGYNFPFTPPYYHGEAWADITFTPLETKKYTLQEIINQSSVEFYRYYLSSSVGTGDVLSGVDDATVIINDQAMQIASSVNIFSQGVLEQDITAQGSSNITNTTNVQVDTDISNKYRWIIQTKFETPILNFSHYGYGKHSVGDYNGSENGIELPGVGPMQTPIGMWHQYGHIPQNTNEGVFLQVDDTPRSWIRNAMNKPAKITKRYKSLATLCGFSTDPVRMGEVAGVKQISEAVVAVPFFEKDGRRRFFRMEKEQIDFALDPSKTNLVGRSVQDMVNKMQKFVIPPSLDFVSNREINPFSMYIFEFSHNLTKQDLADIWQNLPPKLNETVEIDEVSISHQLLAYELLGRGGQYRKGENSELELIRNDRLDSVNPSIQWMVFKVKQRAKSSYFEKIFARNESQQLLSQRLKLGVSADALGRKKKISYNWPYDFFSMIEGVKMAAEVHFYDIDEKETKEQEKPVVKPKQKSKPQEKNQNKTVTENSFKAVSGLIAPEQLKIVPQTVAEPEPKRSGKVNRPRRQVKNSIFKSIKK